MSDLRAALAEWDANDSDGIAGQMKAILAAGKMADAIRTALAATPSGGPLDARLLGTAMEHVSDELPGSLIVGYRLSGVSHGEVVEAIASEYARLTEDAG